MSTINQDFLILIKLKPCNVTLRVFLPVCRSDQTCCKDGSGCYTEDQKCDDKRECINGEDENTSFLGSNCSSTKGRVLYK